MSKLIKAINAQQLEFLMFVIDQLAEDLELQGNDVIRLTLGKSQEALHEDILDAYIAAIRDASKRNVVYPQGLPELRRGIAQWYRHLGNPVKHENIMIGSGTSPLYKDLFRLVMDPGDEILIPHPYYSMYYYSSLFAEAKVNFYQVNPGQPCIDIDDFADKFTPDVTKLVVINSPGNPYGNIAKSTELQAILDIVDGQAYVVSDEIYRNVGFYGRVPSVLDLNLNRNRDNLIISNAFSKGFRMYTARVGFLILPDQLVEPFRVLLQHTTLTANPSAQYACLEAVKHLDEVEEITSTYRDNNEYTLEKFCDTSVVTVLKACGGFYLVIECEAFMKRNKFVNSLDLAKDLLQETGVAVVPGSDFGMPQSLRISFTNIRYKEAVDRMYYYFDRK